MLRQNGETSRHCCAIKFFKRIVITSVDFNDHMAHVGCRRTIETARHLYRSAIASPLRSRFAIKPICRPFNCKTAPFSLASWINCAPITTAAGPSCDIDSDDADVRHRIPIATADLAAILIPSAFGLG
jgi:hypothetical protein